MAGVRAGRGMLLSTILVAGCAGGGEDTREAPVTESHPTPSAILATNAFYYYSDLEAALAFYTRILGFETVADYGFAKMLQVAPTSYLTLVDEREGMHAASEPKSVTLALVTEEVEEWWEYMSGSGVEMRAPLGTVGEGRPHDGFVAIDPEGYFLEFERFNPHPENEALIPVLGRVDALYPRPGREVPPGMTSTRPGDLGVRATVLWLYYRDLEGIEDFYRGVFGRDVIVDQGWAKIFPVSSTGFLGFVDGERGLHSSTEDKAVTVSFFTEALDGWLEHLQRVPGFVLRTPAISTEGEFVRTFVGYDPEGYFLEWDTFLDVPLNQELLKRMGPGPYRP
jgi:catechol 2,3-dioxygenase-like lactoylglutathione lyase family enzyme